MKNKNMKTILIILFLSFGMAGCSSATFSNMFGGEKLKTYELKEDYRPSKRKTITIKKAGSSVIVRKN